MGGRGSFKGLMDTIDDVLGTGDGNGKVEEISTEDLKDLYQTEDLIRNKSREVLVVFDKEGKAVKAYQGDKMSVAFPISEAEKWKGYTVTHNHPKGIEGFGGTFSFADMRNATVFRFGSHRAVAAGQGEHNYILKAKKGAKYMDLNRRIAKDLPELEKRMKDAVRQVRAEYKEQDKQKKTYKNYKHMLHIARQKSVGILNSYYRDVANKYGFVYRTQK